MYSSPSKILRVLSANIQAGSSTRRYSDYVTRCWSHALPLGNKQTSLNTIASTIQPYDVVGLQESDPGSLRSQFINQAMYLAEQAEFPYWTHQSNRNVAFIASSGNAVLSRLSHHKIEKHSLPGRIKGRGILLSHLGEGSEGLVIAVAHLALSASSRKLQFDFMAELLSEFPNLILMGDFNCTVDDPEMAILFKNTHLDYPAQRIATFPSWQPKRAIDHVLISKNLRALESYTVPVAYSDHLALALTVEVPLSVLS